MQAAGAFWPDTGLHHSRLHPQRIVRSRRYCRSIPTAAAAAAAYQIRQSWLSDAARPANHGTEDTEKDKATLPTPIKKH